MTPDDLLRIRERLSDRDLEILRTLRAHRLATTTQLRRIHLPVLDTQTSTGPTTRSTQRILARLEGHGLTGRLHQRVGGINRGADATVWQLATSGDRLLALLDRHRRRRYIEPGRMFLEHTVSVTELATQLREAVHTGGLDQIDLTTEPSNWRRFNGQHGLLETLKPDLTAVVLSGDYEDHWFFELDRGSEHGSAITRKGLVYQRYAATGVYQNEHGIFPAVLWIVPDDRRRREVESALRRANPAIDGVHRVVTTWQFMPTVLAGNDTPPPISSPSKGGTP